MKIFVLLVSLVAVIKLSECNENPPQNIRVTSSDFRSLTISWEEPQFFNSSGTATQRAFILDTRLANRPDYFVNSTPTFIIEEFNYTITNLLIDEQLKYKMATKPTPASVPESAFTPEQTASVKSSSLAGEVLVPGKVQNLVVRPNPDKKSTHSAIITWDDPANVQSASNENDKNIQYDVEWCIYNSFLSSKTNCKILTKIVRNMNSTSQSTEAAKKATYYTSNIHPDKNKEIVIIVTPVSLNGTKGPSDEKITRLDPSTKPAAPVNVTAGEIYADELKLFWVQPSFPTVVSAYYIKYNILKNATIMTKSGSGSSATFDGLKAETEYEFQVGILTQNGASEFSAKLNVRTTNQTRPTLPPATTPSSGNLLTSTYLLPIFSLFTFLFKIY